jgi:hypothetical protein
LVNWEGVDDETRTLLVLATMMIVRDPHRSAQADPPFAKAETVTVASSKRPSASRRSSRTTSTLQPIAGAVTRP